MKIALLYTFLFLLSSCSFNFMFLRPSTFESRDEAAIIRTYKDKDTIAVAFDKELAPAFKKMDGTNADMDYAVQSGFILKEDQKDSINYWYIEAEIPNDTVIFFLHGNAGHLPGQHQEMLPFVEKGYSTFMIDYSGFGWSSDKATRKHVLEDALLAFDFLKAHLTFKNKNVLVYGQSLGGHLSVVMTEQRQEDILGLIIEGAFSSHKAIGKDFFGFLGKWFVKEGYSAEESIQNLMIPVLIIHSHEDETIPFHHGEKLNELATTKKAFLQVEKCHICAPFYYSDSIIRSITSLLAE